MILEQRAPRSVEFVEPEGQRFGAASFALQGVEQRFEPVRQSVV